VVEHSLGKGEVVSSILTGSTRLIFSSFVYSAKVGILTITMPDQLSALLVAALLLAGWLIVYWWTYRSRPSDVQAINDWAVANELRVISIYHYWRQLVWMRRGLSLSTFARFYLVIADRPEGAGKSEIYVAFDPLRPGEPKFLEKQTRQ
jgi:hypothetical protein